MINFLRPKTDEQRKRETEKRSNDTFNVEERGGRLFLTCLRGIDRVAVREFYPHETAEDILEELERTRAAGVSFELPHLTRKGGEPC